ncbi:MAG: glycosyltransferase family 4 protein [Desulfuromonas sp.]
MKILALSNLYPPHAVGGYERLCHEVMTELADRDHQISVLTSTYGGQCQEEANHQVLRRLQLLAPADNIYAPFDATAEERDRINQHNREQLQQVVSQEDPDLLFIWNLYFFDGSLLQAVEQLARPAVLLLTDNWLIAQRQPHFLADYFARQVYGRPGWRQRLHRLCARWTQWRRPSHGFAWPGLAIFPSRFMQQLYHQAGLGFARTAVVYHGIAPEAAPAAPAAPADGPLRLLFAGRLVEIKGCHTAIEALSLLKALLPEQPVELTLVGDDRDRPYRQRLQQQVEQLGLASQVHFAPSVAEQQLPRLFAQHHIYLFPSLYEPFSLTLIHALRSGIAVVASRAGGNAEIVRHGENGLLFQPGDARDLARQVRRLVQDTALRRQLGRAGRHEAQAYGVSAMIDQIEQHLCNEKQVGP